MTTYIISFGGLAPTYYAGDNYTFMPDEAIKFDTVESAKSVIAEKFPSYTHPATIREFDTLAFVCTPNW
jgi:hypothetical protein